jgi:hypothetical protein
MRARLILSLLCLLALVSPSIAAAEMGAEDWWELAEELEDPVTILGIAIDSSVVFANHFWSSLEDAWISISLIALIFGSIGFLGGWFKGREYLLVRMFIIMVIITFGMEPIRHSTYVTQDRDSLKGPAVALGSTDSGSVASDVAPILIEIPTRVYMAFHRIFGGAVEEAITASGLSSAHSRVAMAAGSALNDQGVARQLQSAMGSLSEAYRDYQLGCGALILREDTAETFSENDRILLGLQGASMLINPADMEQAQISKSAQETMRGHSVLIHDTGRVTPTRNENAGSVLPVNYPAYRLPSAEYWSAHFGGGVSDANAGHLLDPPDALSGARFRPFQQMIHSGSVTKMHRLPATPNKYWVPANCAQHYRLVQTGFNQLYAGYGANLAKVAGDEGQAACAARGLEAMLARSDSLRAGVTGRRADVWAVEWLESAFGDQAECDTGGAGTSVGSGGEVAPSSALDLGALAQGGASGAMSRAQAAPVSGNDSPRDSDVAQSIADDIWGAWHSLTSELAALWAYLDARRTVPLLIGLCALAYGVTIVAFPFLAAFAVLPGQIRLLTTPLLVLLYIHVLLFALYLVLRLAGWATAELVTIITATPNVRMMLDSPYASMLAALPLLTHIAVGLVTYASWKIVFGGEEKGLTGGRGGATINRENTSIGAGIGMAAMTGPARVARISGIGGGNGATTTKQQTTSGDPSGGPRGGNGGGQPTGGNGAIPGARGWPQDWRTQGVDASGSGAGARSHNSGEGGASDTEVGQGAQRGTQGWTKADLRAQIGQDRDLSGPRRR